MFDLTKFLGFQPNTENNEFSYFDLENGYTTNKLQMHLKKQQKRNRQAGIQGV